MYFKKKLSVLFGLLLIFLIFQNLPGTCAFASTTTPINVTQLLEVVDGQILSLREKNIAKAYHAYTSRNFKEITSLQDFESLINNFSPLSKNKIISLNAIHFLENAASYEGTISSENDEKLIIEYQLIKEGTLWKINGLQLKKNIASSDQNKNNNIHLNNNKNNVDNEKVTSSLRKKIGRPF